MSCTCSNGSCTQLNNCYVCVTSIGFDLFSGNQILQQFTAQTAGLYNVTTKLLNGSPPSSFQVIVNGNILATIPGDGGQANVPVQVGDLVQIQVSWGIGYHGGTIEITTCYPQPVPPPPQPPPSPPLLTYALIAIIAVVIIFAILLILKKKKGT